MNWLQGYRLSEYFQGYLWILTALGIVAVLVSVGIIHGQEAELAEKPANPTP